jgi:hypothetical protein
MPWKKNNATLAQELSELCMDVAIMLYVTEAADEFGELSEELKARILKFANQTEAEFGDFPRVDPDVVLDYLLSSRGF